MPYFSGLPDGLVLGVLITAALIWWLCFVPTTRSKIECEPEDDGTRKIT